MNNTHCSECCGLWLSKTEGYYITRLRGSRATVRFHRHVWEYENKTKVPNGWDVHHIDGNRANNDPRNLIAMPKGQHSRITHIGNKYSLIDMTGRACLLCMATWTKINKKNGWRYWYSYLHGYLCMKCKQSRIYQEKKQALVEAGIKK